MRFFKSIPSYATKKKSTVKRRKHVTTHFNKAMKSKSKNKKDRRVTRR